MRGQGWLVLCLAAALAACGSRTSSPAAGAGGGGSGGNPGGGGGGLATGTYECWADGHYVDIDIVVSGPNSYSSGGAGGSYSLQPSGEIVFQSGPLQAYHSKLLSGGSIGLNSNGDSFYATSCEPKH